MKHKIGDKFSISHYTRDVDFFLIKEIDGDICITDDYDMYGQFRGTSKHRTKDIIIGDEDNIGSYLELINKFPWED
jgi:spore coat polysaccharide biosynthesis predicted glycosyltransferase SpsG